MTVHAQLQALARLTGTGADDVLAEAVALLEMRVHATRRGEVLLLLNADGGLSPLPTRARERVTFN